MNSKTISWCKAGAAGFITGMLLVELFVGSSLPKFQKIHDIEDRKDAFIEFLLPYVERANQRIRRDKEHLDFLERKCQYGALNKRDIRWIRERSASHGIIHDKGPYKLNLAMEELEHRMDEIPPSLALAQAALESAWGTSRFALEGNNLFGIQCYVPGCGIVPENRPAGAIYESAVYSSPLNCFQHYMLILNGNPAYRQMWALRADLRRYGDILEGHLLAAGLQNYSTEREDYIRKVRNVIKVNNLSRFDR